MKTQFTQLFVINSTCNVQNSIRLHLVILDIAVLILNTTVNCATNDAVHCAESLKVHTPEVIIQNKTQKQISR